MLQEHLLRLDKASRRDRFNGVVSDDFVERYAFRSLTDKTFVIGYLVDGSVRAAAELHPPGSSSGLNPEVAFSVENEFRRLGLGSLMFQNIIAEAKRRHYHALSIMTGYHNSAMKALAQKFGARLAFRKGEGTGTISLLENNAKASLRTAAKQIVIE